MSVLQDVEVRTRTVERSAAILGEDRMDRFREMRRATRVRLEGRAVWHVNTTSLGGGVAARPLRPARGQELAHRAASAPLPGVRSMRSGARARIFLEELAPDRRLLLRDGRAHLIKGLFSETLREGRRFRYLGKNDKYLAFLDSRDRWERTFVRVGVEILDSSPAPR